MNNVVLDASAVLAIILGERGCEKLTDELLERAVSSTVNLAEIQTKLVTEGWHPNDAWDDLLSVTAPVEFSPEHAKVAATLVLQTRPMGLSLGDRACLALAIDQTCAVYTADKTWKKLSLGVPIVVIR